MTIPLGSFRSSIALKKYSWDPEECAESVHSTLKSRRNVNAFSLDDSSISLRIDDFVEFRKVNRNSLEIKYISMSKILNFDINGSKNLKRDPEPFGPIGESLGTSVVRALGEF